MFDGRERLRWLSDRKNLGSGFAKRRVFGSLWIASTVFDSCFHYTFIQHRSLIHNINEVSNSSSSPLASLILPVHHFDPTCLLQTEEAFLVEDASARENQMMTCLRRRLHRLQAVSDLWKEWQ